MADEVLIRMPDGAEYAIPEDKFDEGDMDGQGHTYKDLDAKILHYTNGDPYPRPKESPPKKDPPEAKAES